MPGDEPEFASRVVRLPFDLDMARQAAADEVQRLVDELEQTLDTRERRLLHQLRLAAESLGALQAASARPLQQH